MPPQTSAVGAQTLPVPAATLATDAFADPVVDALLDFLAWSLNNDLNTRLAQLPGTSIYAVPNGTLPAGKDFRYAYNPHDRRAPHARLWVPALHVWWDGTSTPWRPGQLQRGIERNINVLYLFDELPGSDPFVMRAGLFTAVDESFAKAAERGGHPSYSYNSKPAGTALDDSTGPFCMWEWEYLGGKGLPRIGIDDPNTSNFGPTVAGKTVPGFAALVRVREIIQPPQPEDPGDVLTDGTVTILQGDLEIMDRTFEPDDGSGALPE